MPSPTRRRLLASFAGLSGLGGCTTDRSREPTTTTTRDETEASLETTTVPPTRTGTALSSPEPSTTSTLSPTPEPITEPLSTGDLEFVVTVLRQPTRGAPGRLRAALTNHSGGFLSLSGGDPLPVGFGLHAERVNASSPLVLFPQQSDAVNDYFLGGPDTLATVDDAVFDGCWRLPDEVSYTTAGQRIRLPDDASIVADYFPLGRHGAGCPDGTYVAHGEMGARSGTVSQTIETTMRVRVEPAGALAVEGSLTVSEENR